MDCMTLDNATMQQSNASAAADSGAFLQAYYAVLNSLIGSALTDSLLRFLWENYSSGLSAQDMTL